MTDPASSASGSSASAGWVRCTPGPTARLLAALPRQLRCGRGWWPWPTPTRVAARARRARRTGSRTPYADWTELLAARRRRRGQRVRAELRAPRDRRAAVAEAGKHLWVEKPAGPAPADTVGDRRGRRARRACSRRSASTTATPRRSSWPASWSRRVGSARSRRSTCACSPTTPPIRTARCRGASTPSSPGPACSVTWPATASTWRRTSAGSEAGRITELVRRPGDVHHRAPGA